MLLPAGRCHAASPPRRSGFTRCPTPPAAYCSPAASPLVRGEAARDPSSEPLPPKPSSALKDASRTLYSASSFASKPSSSSPPSPGCTGAASVAASGLAAASAASSSRCSLRLCTYATRSTSRSKKAAMAAFSVAGARRRLRGISIRCNVPWSSPAASSCADCCANMLSEVTAALPTLNVVLGSCVRSARSHTSTAPSAFARKSTPARVGDQHPAVRRSLL
mmetsp:Transcript_3748/g.9467  ORF Transcript_3748/g.9467 Transcript_3748/m.9467 type:complete len:221 (-) Transcript_3748:2093-2755(-)